MDVEKIRDSIKEPREKLLNHKLYTEIKSIEDLQIFTSNHIFAVWDFMSLLKALQNNLTCTKVPWTPNKNSETAYLINEIVLAEETDISQDGKRKSHYELYLDAMIDIGVKVENIEKNIMLLSSSNWNWKYSVWDTTRSPCASSIPVISTICCGFCCLSNYSR